MSLNDLMPEEQADEFVENPHQYTIQDLISMFGVEAVRRGISYTASLSDAEQEFVDSATDSDEYGEKFIEQFTDGQEEGESASATERIQRDWEEGMKDGGLGLDE